MWVLTKLELNRKGKKSQFGITNGVPCRINTKEKAKSKQTELQENTESNTNIIARNAENQYKHN